MARCDRSLIVGQPSAYFCIDLLTTSKKHITDVGTAKPFVHWLREKEVFFYV